MEDCDNEIPKNNDEGESKCPEKLIMFFLLGYIVFIASVCTTSIYLYLGK